MLLDFEAGTLLEKSTAALSLESDDEMNVKPGLDTLCVASSNTDFEI